MTVNIPNSQALPDFNINELTHGTLDGTGVFDVLMDAVKVHLHEEFKAERIRATDYANAYIRGMEVALQTSSQYAISKAKLGAELQLMAKEIQKVDATIKTSQYQDLLIQAQTKQVTQETDNIKAKLPKEVLILDSQKAMLDAQCLGQLEQNKLTTAQASNITTKLPKELLLLDAQTLQTNKQTDQLTQKLPKELLLLTAQEAQIKGQTAQVTSQTAQIVAQTNAITAKTPKEIQVLDSQIGQTNAQTSAITSKLPKEIALLTSQDLQVKEQTKQIAQHILVEQAQQELTGANVALVSAQASAVSGKLNKELALMEKDIILKDKQVPQLEADTALKAAQISLMNEELKVKQAQVQIAQGELEIKTSTTTLNPSPNSTGARRSQSNYATNQNRSRADQAYPSKR